MAMTFEVQAAIRNFEKIILEGIPLLLRQNETAFLSIMCSIAAIDALSGYRHSTNIIRDRFPEFITEYFPASYRPHAANLYSLRCRILHNFSPAYFSLSHANASQHLTKSPIGDTVLSDNVFFEDLKNAAGKFFDEVRTDPNRQNAMQERLLNINKGGAIYTE